jgi:hypothetical protein
MRNKMEIQILSKSEALYVPFVPVNNYSPVEYLQMREMLTEAEALGIVRDWAIY